MAGKVELLTPSNGKVALVGEDTATDVTVTVPAGTDTLLNTSSDIEAQVKTATNASGSAPIYACRAWVNFDGTGTPAIRASGNVSSITDNGTGQFTVNFTTGMPDANYGVGALGGDINNGVAQDNTIVTTKNQTSSSISILARNVQSSGAVLDPQMVSLAIFR